MGAWNEDVYIYTISYPDTEKVFYVGETSDFKLRFKQHFNGHVSPTSDIIKSIREETKNPVFTIVEKVKYAGHRTHEKKWIDKYIKDGHQLVNSIRKAKDIPFNILDGVDLNAKIK